MHCHFLPIDDANRTAYDVKARSVEEARRLMVLHVDGAKDVEDPAVYDYVFDMYGKRPPYGVIYSTPPKSLPSKGGRLARDEG